MADDVKRQLENVDRHLRNIDRCMKREDAILDAYINSGKTGRPYAVERDELLRERCLDKK